AERFLLSRNNIMQKLFAALVLTLVATPVMAQRRVDLIFDVEGVRQNSKPSQFTPNERRFEPRFNTGGGLGLGVNWFMSDRLSLEAKASLLSSSVRLRRRE